MNFAACMFNHAKLSSAVQSLCVSWEPTGPWVALVASQIQGVHKFSVVVTFSDFSSTISKEGTTSICPGCNIPLFNLS